MLEDTSTLDKHALLSAVLDSLTTTRAMMAAAADDSRRGATHPESRQEGSKDMRSTEQSYLARGQAMRVDELDESIKRLRYLTLGAFGSEDAVAVGALVWLEDADDEDAPRVVFVLSHGGGVEIQVRETTITVVTGASPLGKAIIGRCQGDEVELRTGAGKKEWIIAKVA